MNLSYGKHSLWTDSPCSMNFPNYVSTIERSRRFEFDSIYFRDDPCKPATDIDEFLMPDLILKRFRSYIKDVYRNSLHDKHFKKTLSKIKFVSSLGKISPRASMIAEKLYYKQYPLAPFRDRYGNLSSFKTSELKNKFKLPLLVKPNKKKNRKVLHLSAGLRMDIGRPMNFNPGPGHYFSKADIEANKFTTPVRRSTFFELADKRY